MSTSVNHLPECWCAGRCPTYEGQTCPCRDCLCDELRACEQRVRGEYESQDCYTLGFSHGINEGVPKALDAAREAVETAWTDDPSWDGTNWNNALHEALAAIDALREEQK